ncbi:MAG: SseB family protein, partial [Actinomycetota bacterium]|nr:SseB family protein [Actinomycetota bacterium]
PTLVGVDGRRALPAFTSLGSMRRWRVEARPIPVEATRAALSAVTEKAHVLVLDVAGPVPYVVEDRALRALAQGRDMSPLYDDGEVRDQLARAVAGAPGISSGHLEPAEGVDARVVLVATDAGREEVRAAAQRVAEALQQSTEVRGSVVRGLEIVVRGG